MSCTLFKIVKKLSHALFIKKFTVENCEQMSCALCNFFENMCRKLFKIVSPTDQHCEKMSCKLFLNCENLSPELL